MCKLKNILVIIFILLPASLFAQTGFQYETLSQGDWAVVMVYGLKLDEGRDLTEMEDFFSLLEENGISPEGGWQADEKLSFSDLAATIAGSMVLLDSKGGENTFITFFSFLETSVGINIDQLLTDIGSSEALSGLEEKITTYKAQKVIEMAEGDLSEGSPATTGAGAAASPVSSLAAALAVPGAGDYWTMFTQPVSSILPSQGL